MSPALAVRGGLVVAPDGVREADVLIDGERIVAITPPGEAPGETIDARGCVVLPGAVDAHVHCLSDPTEGITAATRAAARVRRPAPPAPGT